MRLERSVAVGASVLALGTLGVGAAWAMARGSSAEMTTTIKTSTTKTTAAPQMALLGKVTHVSVSSQYPYFVENGKTIFVTRKTSYHRFKGGVGGIQTNRVYRVVFKHVNDKYIAVSITRY